VTLLPKNTPKRVRNKLKLIFSKARKKGKVKDLTAKVENIVKVSMNPVQKARFTLGLINPIACMLYIIRPSIKLPIIFTKSVPKLCFYIFIEQEPADPLKTPLAQ
jgi:hypothetical protein